jgi:hypothetical protein
MITTTCITAPGFEIRSTREEDRIRTHDALGVAVVGLVLKYGQLLLVGGSELGWLTRVQTVPGLRKKVFQVLSML